MSKATPEVLSELGKVLDHAAEGLKKVTARKMFGCHALFADDAVFGLVWKEGRLGVRLPNEELYSDLMALKGAAPWKAGPMVMSHWVLVPESMHKASDKLKAWVMQAHELALSSEKKPKKSKTIEKKATIAKKVITKNAKIVKKKK